MAIILKQHEVQSKIFILPVNLYHFLLRVRREPDILVHVITAGIWDGEIIKQANLDYIVRPRLKTKQNKWRVLASYGFFIYIKISVHTQMFIGLYICMYTFMYTHSYTLNKTMFIDCVHEWLLCSKLP